MSYSPYPDLELTNLGVGDATVGLRFWHEQGKTQWEITHIEGELKVEVDD